MKLSAIMTILALIDHFSQRWYRLASRRAMILCGVRVEGLPLWVSPRIFWDSPPSVMIGDRVVVSHYVRLLTHDFSLDRVSESKYGVNSTEELCRHGGIEIHARAFIGLGALIMPGVVVGEGSIIAAGAVVTRSVEPGMVVGGNPARTICTTDEYWTRSREKFTSQARRR